MARVVTKQSALDELILRGVAQPTWQLAPGSISYSSLAEWDSDDDEDNDDDCDDPSTRPLRWNEPMPGRNPQEPHSGFDPSWVSRRFESHEVSITLYEVNASDGIEVCQARAIFSNLSRRAIAPAIANGVDKNTLQSLQTLGMALWLSVDRNLNWYSPLASHEVATHIVKELAPMPYGTFKKTFRYFLLMYTDPRRPRGKRLKANVSTITATQLEDYFFDHLADSSESSVRLGLNNETADQAWAHLPGDHRIARATFNQLWALYRSGRVLWQKARRVLKMRFIVYYWASLAARPDAAGNAPPAAIDAFHREF